MKQKIDDGTKLIIAEKLVNNGIWWASVMDNPESEENYFIKIKLDNGTTVLMKVEYTIISKEGQ